MPLTSLPFENLTGPGQRRARHKAFLVLAVNLTITLLLTTIAYVSERAHLIRKTMEIAEYNGRILVSILHERGHSLERMAKRWEIQPGGTPEYLWRADARNYVLHLEGLKGIGYADPQTIIRWIEPLEANAAAVGFRMESEKVRAAAIKIVRETQEPTLTPSIHLKQGGLGFLLLVPVITDGSLIYAAIRYDEFFASFMHEREYAIDIYEGATRIYSSNLGIRLADRVWEMGSTHSFVGTEWRVMARPSFRTLLSEAGILPLFVAVIGAAFSLLFARISLANGLSRIAKIKAENFAVWNHAIVNGSQMAIFSTDAKGIIRSVNPAAVKLLGYGADELLNTDKLVTLLDPNQVQERSRQYAAELGHDVEPDCNVLTCKAARGLPNQALWYFTHKNGERRSVLLDMRVLSDLDRNFEGFVGFAEDITEKLQKDEALKAALAKAEAATRAKSQFLANMSHEIRTPINGVLGMAGLLLDTPLQFEQKEYVQAIKLSGENLRTIINDILDLSKIEAGKLELEITDFSLPDLIKGVQATMRMLAEAKGIAFAVETQSAFPRSLMGDPTRLRQILLNLTSNAIKFTAQGTVTLRILNNADTEASRSLRFEIIDTGIGIAKEVQSKLFQSFAQADSSTTRKYGGTGLGLSICRELVEMMGGRIGVASELGHGSTFWFEMTFAVAAQQNAPEIQLTFSPPRKLSILLAEDNHINQTIARRILEKHDHKVTIAASGLEVIAALQRSTFDLVLMDGEMPGMDGFEATRLIRSAAQPYRSIPIIAMTANAMLGDRERCLAAGMTDYLAKPIKPEELFQIIARVMQDHRQAA